MAPAAALNSCSRVATQGPAAQQGAGTRGLALGAGATITDMVNLIVQSAARSVGEHAGGQRGGNVVGRSGGRLTAREREVLSLVAAGISNKGIARALQVSPNTVKFHIAGILQKLDAASRAEAVVAALRRGDLTL